MRCSGSKYAAGVQQAHLSHTPPLAPAARRHHQQQHAAALPAATQSPHLWLCVRPHLAAASSLKGGVSYPAWGFRESVVLRAVNGSLPSTTATAADPTTSTSSSSAQPAAEAAADPGTDSSRPSASGQDQEGGPSSNAASTWEEEIEETLKLVSLLPPSVRSVLEQHSRLYELLEVVMDLGRPPTARFPGRDEKLSDTPVAQEDLDYAVQQVGQFGGDNRAGIDATLHRISCLRNRAGRIVGLTCRVGRAIHGSAGLVADLVSGGASVLFMGRPGVGKTTAIRELSRLLADDLQRRVVIVDTSNEIGGDGDVPHAGIGRARRMQVPDPEQQHRVMIEAVENHMPQVVVIDEIGTEAECSAARTIAQRGVQLVATAHGNELQNLVKNPALSDLIGGIQSVTLGDDEAKRRGVQKSILERAAPPTFDVAVEMLERTRWCVYTDVAAAVDSLLGGHHPGGEMRQRQADGSITKYTFSRDRQAPGPDEGVYGSRRGSSSSSRGSSSSRVLPDLSGGASSPVPEADPSSSPTSNGFLRRLFVNEEQARPGSPAGAAGRRIASLGLSSPESAVLRLYASELDAERLWEVMSAMGLHDKVYMAPRPSEADAVLAVRSKLRSNAGLRQAARQAGVPVYAIKSSSSSNLIRAFRTLMGQEPSAGGLGGVLGQGLGEDGLAGAAGGAGSSSVEQAIDLAGSRSSGDDTDADEGDESSAGAADAVGSGSVRLGGGGGGRALHEEEDGLEEARLAVEQIVMPLQQPVELLPRSDHVRQAQGKLCERYGLSWELVGSGDEARLRVCPKVAPAAAAAAAGPAVGSEAASTAAVGEDQLV